jgi:hypothetical protein
MPTRNEAGLGIELVEPAFGEAHEIAPQNEFVFGPRERHDDFPSSSFGLSGFAVGSDADIVVFDPEKKLTITAANQHSKTDYNLYEGTEVTGSPEVVLLRGHVLVEDDELVASPGIGQYVARARFGQELKSRTAVA